MRKGKGDCRIGYRLSPNEIEQLSKEETIRRRKLRIVQVREQSKANAAKIRGEVKREKAKQLNKLAGEIKDNLEKEKQEKVTHLQQQYENSLKSIGTAHRAAHKVKDNKVEKLCREEQQKRAALNRYETALKKSRKEHALKHYEENKHIIARKAALETEVMRAADIASLPPPPPDPVEVALQTKSKPIPMTDMNAFSTTHYHMPDYAVVKAGSCEQIDAIEAGVEEDERIKLQLKDRKHLDQDRIIRARIRGNEALRREHLRHEYSHMLQDLSLLQRADRRRRQEEVADLPKQVFLPPDRRLEEKETKQRDMEKAFEDMYLADKHPAILMSLDTQTPPDTPSSGGTEDPTTNTASRPAEDRTGRDLTNASSDTNKQNETALMKLFSRIKEQKEDHATRSALETTLVGDFVKPSVHKSPLTSAGTNGMSPLSEYTALETCSLPSTANQNLSPVEAANQNARQRPQANQMPRQVVVKSPQTKSPLKEKKAASPETPEEKRAMQEKIYQLEEKQKELDALLNRFKHFTEMTQIGQSHASSNPIGQQFSQSAPTTNTGMINIQSEGPLVQSAPLPGSSQGQALMTNGSSKPHPSGIYHAKPVQITAKEGGEKLESGFYSGLPASFQGYHSIRAGNILQRKPGEGLDYGKIGYLGTSMDVSRPMAGRPGDADFARDVGYPGAQGIASHSLELARQADHVKRVREYQERILQSSQRDLPNFSSSDRSHPSFTSGSSSGLAQKVKDYQQQILEGNADRRTFLAETKANIERQRQELYRKYPLTMGGGASGPPESNVLPDQSLADRILNEIRDPFRPRSLDMADVKSPNDPGKGLSTSQISTTSSKERLERIKRSLLFEDPDESLTRTPGRDISLLAPSEDGDLTLTSSSERGSPNLSKSVRSDGSVAGMSLINRAQETGNIFEKRQLELQRQLEEVQRQKEEILHRYELGQQRIQDSSSFSRGKMDTTSSSGLSNTFKSNFTDHEDTSFASLPNLRPGRTDSNPDQRKNMPDFSLSVLSEFPKTLEQFSLLDSEGSARESASSMSKTNERSPTDAGRLFSTDLDEESLSQVSLRSQPFQSQDRPSQSGSLTLEEESLSPLSTDPDKITWANLLTGPPTVSSTEENGFKLVESKPSDYVAHDLSTIFEVDTPTTGQAVRDSGQFVTLTSTQSSSIDTL